MNSPLADGKTKRLNREGWVSFGIHALKNDGPEALTVEELCSLAGKTRGSFYFHFTTIDDFLHALTNHWVEEFTDQIVERAAEPAYERQDLLNQLAGRLDPKLEQGMRRLAARNNSIAGIVNRADTDRISYLTRLYSLSGAYSEDDAEALAKIEYAAFTGFQLTMPDMSIDESRGLYEQFLKLTGRN